MICKAHWVMRSALPHLEHVDKCEASRRDSCCRGQASLHWTRSVTIAHPCQLLRCIAAVRQQCNPGMCCYDR